MTDSVAESSIVIEKKTVIMGAFCLRLQTRTRGKWREANAGVRGGRAGAKYLKEEPFPPSLRQKQTAGEL